MFGYLLQQEQLRNEFDFIVKVSWFFGPFMFLTTWGFIHLCLKRYGFRWWGSFLATCVFLTVLSFVIPNLGLYLTAGWLVYLFK